MTALTATPAPAGRGHPVPWRPMARATWLQHRAALITLLAVSIALALAIVAGRLAIGPSYEPNTMAASTNSFTALVIAVHVLPVVIGVFAGAPLISRELESGTFRFTWTQGIGRTRYVLTTLALLAAAAAAATCALGVLLGWYAHPFDAAGIQSRWQPGLFDTTPLTLPAWTLAALSIGTFLGTLTGRIVAAIAATGAAAGGLRLAAFWNLDHRLLNLRALAAHAAPLGYLSTGPLNQSATPGFGPAGSWLVRGWVTGPGGQVLSTTATASLNSRIYAAMSHAGSKAGPATWLSAHHYAYWLSYQPASQFWYFQGITGTVLIALATISTLITIRLIRRG